MAFDGSGNYSRTHNWTSDAANSLDINAGEMDQEDNSIAGALNIAVTRDGQGKMAADFLPKTGGLYNMGTSAVPWATFNGIPTAQLSATLSSYRSIFTYFTAAQIADVQARTSLVNIDAAVATALSSFAANGGTLYCPAGLYDLSTKQVTPANFTMVGDGQGATVFRAKAAANLQGVLQSLVSNVTFRDMTVDGNRANGGLNPTPTFEASLYLGGSNNKALNCEVKGGTGYGLFVGSSVATPDQILIDGCYIHDNGGVISAAGFGIGIQTSGAFPPNDMTIVNCRIEHNHNTVTGPGGSAGCNIDATRVLFAHNYLKDNFNSNGGQAFLASDLVNGITDGFFTIVGNVITQTANFGGDLTCGFEIMANKFVCSNNVIIENLGVDAIRVEASGGDGVVSNNVLIGGTSAGASGVNLINTAGAGIKRCRVNDNQILGGHNGIQVQTNPGNVHVIDNYIDASVTAPFPGAVNCALVRGNVGFVPPGATPAVGASPYVFPILNMDVTYYISVPNGITAWALDTFFNAQITINSQIFCKAGHTVTVTWAGSAPSISYIPQQ